MLDKSPLNYIGGKYKMLPQIMKFFPRKINNMYDLLTYKETVAEPVEEVKKPTKRKSTNKKKETKNRDKS